MSELCSSDRESPARQRTRLKKDLTTLRERYGPETELARGRTTIEEAAPAREIPMEAMIEREPVTSIMSQRGWIRAMKGHADLSVKDQFKFKEGDGPAFAFHAQTTDKLLLVSTNGRFYTLGADKLPGGRGFGETVRLLVDVANDSEILALLPDRTGGKPMLTAEDGRGVVANNNENIAETPKGRPVVKPKLQTKQKI